MWTSRPRKQAFPPRVRRAILRRDPVCVRCGQNKATQADHTTPTAEGGSNTIDNGQGLCGPCHQAKTRSEWRRGYKRWNKHERPRQAREPEQHPGFVE